MAHYLLHNISLDLFLIISNPAMIAVLPTRGSYMVQKVEKIWMDGKFVNWDDANVHILTHTLHYGLGVFEGIRCYKCENGKSAVFRLKEHTDRLFESAHIMQIEIPFTRDGINEAIIETLKINDLKEGYIRPLAYL